MDEKSKAHALMRMSLCLSSRLSALNTRAQSSVFLKRLRFDWGAHALRVACYLCRSSTDRSPHLHVPFNYHRVINTNVHTPTTNVIRLASYLLARAAGLIAGCNKSDTLGPLTTPIAEATTLSTIFYSHNSHGHRNFVMGRRAAGEGFIRVNEALLTHLQSHRTAVLLG